MEKNNIHTAIEDAVQSLDEAAEPRRIYVFTKNAQVVRMAEVLIATTIISLSILFLLFIIIMYS